MSGAIEPGPGHSAAGPKAATPEHPPDERSNNPASQGNANEPGMASESQGATSTGAKQKKSSDGFREKGEASFTSCLLSSPFWTTHAPLLAVSLPRCYPNTC